jgi:HK97 family phage prohead protease
MPYAITDKHPDCSAWAVVKEDGELLACHATEDEAIAQMVAVSIAEDMDPLGTYEGDTFKPRPERDFEPAEESRQVDLEPPAYMRASARRGLEWHRDGLSGDGLVERTVREATAMAEGNVTADKWVRIRAWIARHIGDLDAPAADPSSDDYPSPGVVAMALWGGGGTKRSAERALAYAEGIVLQLEAENEGRAKGEAVSKLETRVFEHNLELREESDGMHLEGYAAIFNSRSENLGGFTEVIQPGAFRGSLRSRNDIKFLWNHNTGDVLGSTRAGTLKLTEDDRGLRVSAILPNTTLGNDVRELVRRGDISGFSFGFSMPSKGGDSWSADGTERTLKAVRLHEVSLTAFPAYTATNGTATVRHLDKVCQRANVDADALADALLKMESGVDLSEDDRNVVERVLDELSPRPEVEPEADNSAAEILALKKAKLKLLMQDF